MYCDNCNQHVNEEDANYRTEDNTFSAAYGDYEVVIGGNVDEILTCPECGDDLSEVVE